MDELLRAERPTGDRGISALQIPFPAGHLSSLPADQLVSEARARLKVKERVLDAVRGMPDDATVEDAMERLYFLAKVEEGLRQANAGVRSGW